METQGQTKIHKAETKQPSTANTDCNPAAYNACYTDSDAPPRHKLERVMHQGQLGHDRRSNQPHHLRHAIYAANQ
ncbi:hypothetical protein N7501_008090 [Penicillium viridicatum]|nr:hypothetical protein N7501_008090 [Penicillium viridicatum]